jgi:hypothetical protein
MSDGEHADPSPGEDADEEVAEAATTENAEPKPKQKAGIAKVLDTADEDDDSADGRSYSNYGIASAVLAVVSVAAIALGALIWHTHRDDTGERAYQTRVMQAAADWTGVLINMNPGNLDASLQRLHDGTVGELNTYFDGSVQPYRQVVEKLHSQSTGQIDSVAVESVHHDLDTRPGSARPVVTTKLPAFATRTDSVMVVATSVSQNAGAKPTIVHWSLRLEVSNVDGKLMISKLESIK